MSRVVISRIAALSALGDGITPLWQGLLVGRCGIAELSRFDCHNYISNYAAFIPDLHAPDQGSLLDDMLDRVAVQVGALPDDSRLLVASTKGEIDRLTTACQNQEPLSMSLLFEPMVKKVAQRFGLKDNGSNINAACASSTIAVMRAAAMIKAGQAETVLVYAADLVSEFVFSGFSALHALSGERCQPFDQQRKGLNLGEAGVALVLMSEERAQQLEEPILAYVAGWGAANDAHHVTAPARDGFGLIQACRQALAVAALDASQIGAINAHGTATVYNDAMELTAFSTVFNDNLPPLHGVKGSLGHCLGAAGGIEIAIACQSLREKQIPGTVGCQLAEEMAQGRLSPMAQAFEGDYLLSSNSGFGGVNAVVILQKGQS